VGGKEAEISDAFPKLLASADTWSKRHRHSGDMIKCVRPMLVTKGVNGQ